MSRSIFRALRRSPGFTTYAVLGLAVGLAVHTAAFSVLYAVLLRPLPFEDPDKIYFVYAAQPDKGQLRLNVSAPGFQRLRQESRCFEAVSGTAVALTTLTVDGRPEMVQATLVTPGFFRVLGVEPVLGRGLSGDGAEATEVVIADSLWRERFEATPEILGRSIQLGDSFFTVAGVLPAGIEVPGETRIWASLETVPLLFPNLPRLLDDPEARLLRVFARLDEGWSPQEARRHLADVARTLETDDPAHWEATTLRLVSFRERAVGHLRSPLFLLQVGAGVLLLLVALNLASLLSARAVERSREMAVRAALGASRGHLTGQVLGESLALTLAGGLLGVGLAAGVLEILVSRAPADLPGRDHIGLQPVVLAVAFAGALVAGWVASLPPALRARKSDLRTILAAGPGAPGGPRLVGRLRNHFGESGPVVVQIALTVALVALAGLLARSYRSLGAVDPGFEARGVLGLSLSLPGERYPDPESLERFYDDALRRLGDLPAVESASAASDLPLEGASCATEITAAQGLHGLEPLRVGCLAVAPGFARTLGIARLRGRDLEPRDLTGDDGPAAVLVNRRLAEDLWPGQDPLERTLTLDGRDAVRVVGMVENVHHGSLTDEPQPMLYLPAYWNNMSLLLRFDVSRTDPATLAKMAKESVWTIDPRQAVYRETFLEDLLRAASADRRFGAWAGGLVAVFALFLGAFGLFGLLSFRVARRLRGLAVRQALGASRGRLLRGVLGYALGLSAVACLLGLSLAWAVSRVASSWLYGVERFDPTVGFGVVLVIFVTALAASWWPARRAVEVDPMRLLRDAP